MPQERVQCCRKIEAAPQDVWAVIRSFDLTWHPFVTSCSLIAGPKGAVQREFETTDGGRLVEQRTYFSDSDRVLCYTALSGIEGALRYSAQVDVKQEGEACQVTWSADIVAPQGRVNAIADGTKAVFEAGLDCLQGRLHDVTPDTRRNSARSGIKRGSMPGTPTLTYLTSAKPHPKADTLVLCLHGIGGQASNWSDQIAAFGADYNIAALNLRGYGGSTLGSSSTQIEDHCEDILEIANQFGAKQLVLVGLSMGSWIATSFAMRHGDMLAGLVLAGGCTGMSEADPQERKAFRVAREAPLLQGQTPADFAQAVVDIIAGPNATVAMRTRLHQSMSDIPSETYRDALNCFCNPPERFAFARLSCPVLMMTGEFDKLAPPEEIRNVSMRIHDAATGSADPADLCFDVLSDAGHLCNMEQPEAFNATLGRFLDRLPQAAVGYKPNRAQKQRHKRDRILQAALGEFCKVGFDGASMDRLARSADVSKPTLYQYFGDKEGLFAAVLDQGRAHIIAPLATNDGTLVDRLWRFSWTYAEFVLRPDMLSLARLILGEAGRRPESAARYHQSGPAQAFEGLVEFVSAGHARGELKVDDARLAANDLWSLILSGPRDYYLHHVNEQPKQTQLLEVIGHGLGVFLKAYSCHLVADEKRLAEKIKDMQGLVGGIEGEAV